MKLTKFQIIILVIFSAGILIGLAVLSLTKSTSTSAALPSVTIWGVVPEQLVLRYISDINLGRPEALNIDYIEKDVYTIEDELVEELALGNGPDAILVPQELLLTFENKLIPIPYVSINARDYKNTFIEQAELYMRDEGILGIPLFIDPLVMYWNRDMFTNAGIASYPKIWDDFLDVGKKINQKDINSNIRRSSIALGEFGNVSNARDIFSLILLQASNPIVQNKQSALGGQNLDITENAINFFSGFSNPSSPAYSWNRSLPLSKNYFLSGNLATYFGYASEVNDIKDKNPNLNFDIAPMPQPKNAKQRINYSRMYGFSIVKSSKNPVGVYAVLSELTSFDALSKLVPLTYLPPVRRDLIDAGNVDPYLSIFYDSALISRGWLDPDPFQSAALFQNLIESVVSGRELMTQAISQIDTSLNSLLNK
jgi:ABC-type glycerol-3-phosphate transport system substrate-binding protein